MRRFLNAGTLVPVLLALVGVALIIAGRALDEPGAPPSLPPIVTPTQPVAQATPTPTPTVTVGASPSPPATPTASPSPTPVPDDWVAVQLQIEAVGINVRVREAFTDDVCRFPPVDAAYIICDGSQPGRGTNSYIFAHARGGLFLNLWNVRLGDEVLVQMSDGQVLRYVVTEVHANVACPDPNAPPHPNPPPALRLHDDCSEATFWLSASGHERLTLQTSQGLNRNWGEFIVVAKPIGWQEEHAG